MCDISIVLDPERFLEGRKMWISYTVSCSKLLMRVYEVYRNV